MSLRKNRKVKTNVCAYTTSLAPLKDQDSSTDYWYVKIRNGLTILYVAIKQEKNEHQFE